MIKKILIALLFLVNITNAQVSSCPNSDFELGDFSGWNGQTGNCCPISTTPFGITAGRQTIMSGTGTDPNTCNKVTVVAPGGLYSARLGNDSKGAEAEKLTYSLVVDPSNSLFIYKYAVVLEDPSHSESEQPRFQIRIVDDTGTLIDPICGQYSVVAASSIPGFQTCNGSIRYKDWTTVGLDLSSYAGKNITIEFATGDCSLGGHYGYAYVDAFCSPLKINSNYCSGSLNAILTAPIGFTYLWNTGATTQSITVTDPKAGLNYSCQLTSVTGCQVDISTILQIEPLPNPEIANGVICFDSEGNLINPYIFNTGLSSTANIFQWYFNSSLLQNKTSNTLEVTSIGSYSVIATNVNTGCVSNLVSASLTSAQRADDIIVSVQDVFSNKNVLTIIVQGGDGPFQYQLDDNPFQTNNVYNALKPGIHKVTVASENNCTYFSKEVIVLGYPKFFTPNQDGYNEFWNIYNFENRAIGEVSIFDRYGKFIKKMSITEQGWDGMYNGRPLPSSDYWFSVDYQEMSIKGQLEWKTFKSHFTLKR